MSNNKHINILFVVILTLGFACSCNNLQEKTKVTVTDSEEKEYDWWPAQKKPLKIIICEYDEKAVLDCMLAESLAGIAAKSVNKGQNDELVWFEIDSPFYTEWFKKLGKRLGNPEIVRMKVWELLGHFHKKRMINGYVTYSYDNGEGQVYQNRENVDKSANIATTVAGILTAVIADKSQTERLKKIGISELYDARGKEYDEVYAEFKDSLSSKMTMIVDPKAPNHRDMAIAHNIFVFEANGETEMGTYFKNIEVSSPVLGWGHGDEARFTGEASKAGLYAAATNWCKNLPLMSAGSFDHQNKKVKTLHPKNIDWNKQGHFHSFIMSDGDNMQWFEQGFFHSQRYWANKHHGEFPMGWTSCSAQLLEMMPDVHDYMAETQPENSTIIEFGGGYHYPDQFGENREQEKALRVHAKKVNAHMQKAGTKVFGFICMDLENEASKKAYQIYAEEIDGLTGMIAIQYNPYEGGDGKIYWTIDKNGIHIPVVTAKYALWANLDHERAGNPEKIARLINKEVLTSDVNDQNSFSWTSVHAWSEFEHNGEVASGLTPVKWTINQLTEKVNVVNPEELLWRIRMENFPEEVKQKISQDSND